MSRTGVRTVTAAIAAAIAFGAAGCTGTPATTTTTTTVAPEPGRFQGLVTTSDTGEPLSDVPVAFYSDDGTIEGAGAYTDEQGFYSKELPPGSYRVFANSPNEVKPYGWNGFAPVWTGNDLTGVRNERLVLTPGATVTFNARLPRLRAGTGRVIAQGGPGLTGSGYVTAVRFTEGAGWASLPLPADGAYSFPLPDGEWQIEVDVPGYQRGLSSKVVVAGAAVSFPDVTLQPA